MKVAEINGVNKRVGDIEAVGTSDFHQPLKVVRGQEWYISLRDAAWSKGVAAK